jgi:hypothetical protein
MKAAEELLKQGMKKNVYITYDAHVYICIYYAHAYIMYLKYILCTCIYMYTHLNRL